MTLEEHITFINSAGWLVGSLCQLAHKDWYVCLIDDAGFTHTATASDPCDAFAAAYENPPGARVWSRTAGIYEEKLDLVALGLLKPKAPIDRRF